MIQFVADAMLGRLTRWLRILGYAVFYDHALYDDQILALAQAKNGILLTRDHELHERAQHQDISCLYLCGVTVQDKLVEIATRYSLSFHLDAKLSRCAICGAHLQHVEKTTIQTEIHVGTFNHFSEFWRCQNCGKVYWQGSHWNRITQTVAHVTNIVNKSPPDVTSE
jgi:uncharacterized protein with PIN domain